VTRFLARGPFLGEAAAQRSRAALDLFIDHWKEHGFGGWAVIDRATGALIGQCGLKYLPDSPEVEILYAFDTPHWGRGVATEAAAAALRHGFESTRLDRVVAVALPKHRLAPGDGKLGMTGAWSRSTAGYHLARGVHEPRHQRLIGGGRA
jgi:ribosomal-protein-alanine N-acetyltransferase